MPLCGIEGRCLPGIEGASPGGGWGVTRLPGSEKKGTPLGRWRGKIIRGYRSHSFLPLPRTKGREETSSLPEMNKIVLSRAELLRDDLGYRYVMMCCVIIWKNLYVNIYRTKY